MNPKFIIELGGELFPAGVKEAETLVAKLFGEAGMPAIKTVLVDAAAKTGETTDVFLSPLRLGTEKLGLETGIDWGGPPSAESLADGSFARAMENLRGMTDREAALARMSHSVGINSEGIDLARFQRLLKAAQLRGTAIL